MSTAILLSSSPPRIFARSPTSADSSPYLPSPSDLFRGSAQSPQRFKANVATRDGFAAGSSGARSLLADKRGAENVQLGSPFKNRFKPSSTSSQLQKSRANLQISVQNTVLEHSVAGARIQSSEATGASVANPDPANSIQLAAEHDSEGNLPSSAPVQLDKAVPRRTDWTPLKEDADDAAIERVDWQDESTSFPKGLMASFGLGDLLEPEKRIEKDVADPPKLVKRRKVELIEKHPSLPEPREQVVKEVEANFRPVLSKRTKSPAKKPVTITHLATSHYLAQENISIESPIMQYLDSTQVRNLEAGGVDELEVLSTAFKQKGKEANAKRAQLLKPKLLSPKSAMHKVEAQETIFGSASQLVQEEYVPTKVDLTSDALSPGSTQPTSISSTTPRTGRGTVRFVRTRNLWAAAGRDEDNALLHVETVNLYDTPRVKEAFAGKDALVAPVQSDERTLHRLPRDAAVPRRTGTSPLSTLRRVGVLDVDDFSSPLAKPSTSANTRALHTVATAATVETSITPLEVQKRQKQNRKGVSAVEPELKSKIPHKPSYVGLDTSILQKHIKAYGFKPVKKREKMIELLEMCWEAKYAKHGDATQTEDDYLKHGDILSNVHDVSIRPEPKVKKPRKPTKAQACGDAPVTQTKRRKKADSTMQDPAKEPKVQKPRKSRSKKAAPAEELAMLDSDNFGTAPPRLDVAADSDVAIQVSAPLPMLSANFNVDRLQLADMGETREVAQTPDLEQGLGDQIQAAILQQSDDAAESRRNHVQHPTWHEKILMYDPIILEDLTAWLNTEGLNRIKEDREVSLFDVRTWCESKGVCCLWKGGWRGQKSKPTED